MARQRLLARPALSVLLAIAWLLLQQSWALPQLIFAGLLGVGLPWLLGGFLRVPVRPTRPARLLKLLLVVLWDIITANVTVARLVLSPRARPQPAWVSVELDARNPTAITLLASIITMTPGTVSCVIDEAHRRIVVHALDCDDPEALAVEIKARYEAPLQEIFG
jgi:multicomponent K+:H+ antiporter subunit E